MLNYDIVDFYSGAYVEIKNQYILINQKKEVNESLLYLNVIILIMDNAQISKIFI